MGESNVVPVVSPRRIAIGPAMGLKLIHHLEAAPKVGDGPPRQVNCAGDTAHELAHPVGGENTTVQEIDCRVHVAL
jgi:hypothetical protein